MGSRECPGEECTRKVRFEYCGARVCAIMYDGAFWDIHEGGTTTVAAAAAANSYTLSTLPGSQCNVFQPQCDDRSSTTHVPLANEVKTDSFGNELSWEVR